MSRDKRYGYSQLTDTWYIVHEWEDVGDGKIWAMEKERVVEEDVPQEYIETTDDSQ